MSKKMSKRDILIEAVRLGEDTYGACKRLGIPHYVGLIWLKRGGVLTDTNTPTVRPTSSMTIGIKGEQLFSRLVPNAIDVNRTVRQGHADYDFEYKDLTIDVKTSLRRHNGKWSFKLGGGAELFVLMLLSQDGDLEKIFLLPRVLAYCQSLELSVNTLENRLSGYLVAPEELNDALDAIVQDGGGVND